jgi:glycerol-3-phosphate dehydrogenase
MVTGAILLQNESVPNSGDVLSGRPKFPGGVDLLVGRVHPHRQREILRDSEMTGLRGDQWNGLKAAQFDVLIIGGGVSGACLFHHLSGEGYRVLLIDKGDFASATSQSSAMMIWGGLLYLKHLRVGTVWRLCGSRNRLVQEKSACVKPQAFRYLVSRNRPGTSLLINSALHSYWLLGRCRGERPRREQQFPETDFLKRSEFVDSFIYQEAMLDSSDARFALQWVLSPQNENSQAVNYCAAEDLNFNHSSGTWSVDLRDQLIAGVAAQVTARLIVNCTGPWADEVNKEFGIKSPFKHVLSKGVFLGLRRFPAHEQPLIMDTADGKDCMSLIPWGPISLWGPTETGGTNLREAGKIKSADVTDLLTELNRWLPDSRGPNDIVSVRNGVRALVVNKDSAPGQSTLQLSRRFKVYGDRQVPWISVYGGKITDCMRLARCVVSNVMKRLGPPRSNGRRLPPPAVRQDFTSFPGLSAKVLSAHSSVKHEMCWTLEDYLRRRTNISQWVPRGGLGRRSENRAHLVRIAEQLPSDGTQTAEGRVRQYEAEIRNFDQLLAAC